MTVFEIACLITGSAIALYAHLRERTLSGPARDLLTAYAQVAATPVVTTSAAGPDRCPTPKRRQHRSRAQAEAAAAWCRTKRHKDVAAYRCPCGFWHTGPTGSPTQTTAPAARSSSEQGAHQ